MTLKMGFSIILAAAIITIATKAGLNFSAESRQNAIAAQACHLADRNLETGALRDAYEQLKSGLEASGLPNACVTMIDNGRSYAEDCDQSVAIRRSFTCKAAANTGIQATMSFPVQSIFEYDLSALFLKVLLILVTTAVLIQKLTQLLLRNLGDELQGLLGQKPSKRVKGRQKLVRAALAVLGVREIILSKVRDFELQISESQRKAKTESLQRGKLEKEAELQEHYIERVKQIRHDIRSPLSSVQSVFEKMNSGSQEAKSLASAIQRIQILLDDLNQVDRVAASPKLVVTEVVLEEVASMMMSKFQDTKSATISVCYDNEELSPIFVVESEFQSCLENLIENALDAILVGGHVKLNVECDQNFCVISVEDNGLGVSQELLPTFFTKGGTFGKVMGTGLGLYQSKKSIESWGGKINCISLEVGTRFEIRLPLAQAGVTFAGLKTGGVKNQKPKCLLIDDDKAVDQAFKYFGYEISEWASDFASGAALLNNGNPENLPVFVDYRIGESELGTDLIGQQPLRKNIFLCTNDYDDLELIRKAKALGVRIVPKPLLFYGLGRKLIPEAYTPSSAEAVQ